MKKKEPPKSYVEMMKKLEEAGGVVEKDIHRGDISRAKDEVRLSGQYEKLEPKNVKQVIEEQKQIQSKMEAEKVKAAMQPKLSGRKVYNKFGKLIDIAKATGGRGLKALPIIGTGLGIIDAAKAASEGDYRKAGLEALSAVDPTPLTDMYLLGEDVSELIKDQKIPEKPKGQELKEITSSMIKEVGGEPDMRPEKALKLTGEQASPDLEELDNTVNYQDFLKKKKRQFGYE